MIRLVASADAGKAKIVGLADRWATWVVVIALAAAAGTYFVTREIIRSVTILVVFCPCALVLATPHGHHGRHRQRHPATASWSGEGDALERLAAVSRVAFDKTGTLTYGRPQVVGAESFLPETAKERVLSLAAGAEARSEHPLGRAVVQGCRERGGPIPAAEGFQMLPGRGVLATVEGRRIAAGNRELLSEQGIPLSPAAQETARAYLAQGCTLIYLGADGELMGLLALADTVREDAAATVERVKAAGVTPVLLTGDHREAAEHIAEVLGHPGGPGRLPARGQTGLYR